MKSPRSLDYYAGSHWFVSAVTALLVLVFASWLLVALEEAEERSEKMVVEQTWRNMQTGLKIEMAHTLIVGRSGAIAAWIGENPLRWLSKPPPSYRGECAGENVPAEGEWCFSSVQRELLYRPRYTRHLQVPGVSNGTKILRWRVSLSAEAEKRHAFVQIRVENVTPYTWFGG